MSASTKLDTFSGRFPPEPTRLRRRRRFWAWPWELRRQGVLGINARNLQYLYEDNPRDAYPEADDKLLTKRICERCGIPVPQTYAVVHSQGDVRRVLQQLRTRSEFVVKPARGSTGRGILVVTGRREGGFVAAGGNHLSLAEMRYHLCAVLAGLYTLSGQPDCAIIEERIIPHPLLRRIAVGGTPDVRVLLYRKVPLLAMLRLPTQESGGRANLHQGAVGAGVDLETGTLTGGIHGSRTVQAHPDTGATLQGTVIPHWRALLEAAVRLAENLRLRYVGVDFVLDADRGPLVLEVNARPGLAIQLANRRGLLCQLGAWAKLGVVG